MREDSEGRLAEEGAGEGKSVDMSIKWESLP